MTPTKRILLYTLLLALLAGTVLLLVGEWQPAANPAPLSQGHADLECGECHLGVNSSQATLITTCLDCHDEVLDERQAHSPAYLEIVGRRDFPWHTRPDGCLDCHNGHVRAGDGFAGSIPTNQCFLCHASIVEEHDYHLGLGFDTCLSCHQYHGRTLLPPEPR